MEDRNTKPLQRFVSTVNDEDPIALEPIKDRLAKELMRFDSGKAMLLKSLNYHMFQEAAKIEVRTLLNFEGKEDYTKTLSAYKMPVEPDTRCPYTFRDVIRIFKLPKKG